MGAGIRRHPCGALVYICPGVDFGGGQLCLWLQARFHFLGHGLPFSLRTSAVLGCGSTFHDLSPSFFLLHANPAQRCLWLDLFYLIVLLFILLPSFISFTCGASRFQLCLSCVLFYSLCTPTPP